MTFADQTLSGFLDALASPDPTPGGGTASAVAGAMGASLLIMVSGLAKSRNSTEAEKHSLTGARHALRPLTARLMDLADADTEAFNVVMSAYRLPKATDEEKTARSAAIQEGLRQASVVPLDTLRVCEQALCQAVEVATCGNRSAVSDVGVAIGLIEAAALGAEANVMINLVSVKDDAFKDATTLETTRLAFTVKAHAASARAEL